MEFLSQIYQAQVYLLSRYWRNKTKVLESGRKFIVWKYSGSMALKRMSLNFVHSLFDKTFDLKISETLHTVSYLRCDVNKKKKHY